MKILFTTLILLITTIQITLGQGVGIGTSNPHENAILELSSNTQGFILPRMKTTQRIEIPHTYALMVFDTDTNSPWFNNGESWIEMKNRPETNL